MDLEKVLALYEKLEEYLKKYGDNSILQSYKIVKRTIAFLRAYETKEEKEIFLIRSYKSLFPGKGDYLNFTYGIIIWKREKC